MRNATPLPHLTQEGVVFRINLDSMDHECLISREDLVRLSLSKNIDASDADTMDIFHAFESTIENMTRTLIAGRASETRLGETPGFKAWHCRVPRYHSPGSPALQPD